MKTDVPKSKTPFRYKKVGKDKYKYDFVSWDEWENMMNEENGLEKKSIKQILRDIVLSLKDEVGRDIRDDFYDYDRGGFIKSIIKRDGIELDEVYYTDIQTIVTQIVQLHIKGYIPYYDEDGDSLRKNFRIKEKHTRRIK